MIKKTYHTIFEINTDDKFILKKCGNPLHTLAIKVQLLFC